MSNGLTFNYIIFVDGNYIAKKKAGGPNKVGALGRHLGDEIQTIQMFCPPSEETPG